MPIIILSRLAQRDLDRIETAGLLKFGRHQRDKYIVELLETMNRIGQFPEIGQRTHKTNIRRIVHSPHLIFYSLTASGIIIRRIMDGRIHDPVRNL